MICFKKTNYGIRGLVVPVLILGLGPAARAEEARRPAPFGFSGREIFKASNDSACLRVIDLDGDGRLDIVHADNADTSVRLLLQRPAGGVSGPGAADPAGASPGSPVAASVNEVRFDQRFKVEKIYTEKRLFSLDAGDLNGDSKPDIAYYGDPPELVVMLQGGEWGSKTEKFAITDGVQSSGGLRIIDIDGDGREDLVLLGRGKTYLLRQRADGGLSQPEVLHNAVRDAAALEIADVDGDGRLDLITLAPRSERPVVVRFQRPGAFGPEQGFKMFPLTYARFADLDRQPGAELLTIQGNTRRVIAYRWGKRDQHETPHLTDPRLVAFRPEGDAAARRVVFGDLNGDRLVDVAVTYGETAEAEVLLQRNGELMRPVRSPVLSDVKGIAIGDFDGDGAPEMAMASGKEKVIGWSRWLEAGRLSIPRTAPLDEEPLLLAACSLPAAAPGGSEGRRDSLLLAGRAAESGQYRLRLLRRGPEDRIETAAEVAFKGGANPNGMRILDATGDGLPDVLVFTPYEDPRLFAIEAAVPPAAAAPDPDTDAGRGESPPPALSFREISREKDFGIGQLSRLGPQEISAASFPIGREEGAAGDDLLVSSRSHARALRLDRQRRLQILEQFPGRGAAATIQGAAAMNLDADPDLEVLLFDKSATALDILDRGERGIYQQVRSIPMPGFEFQGFEIRDLNGDGQDDVILLGSASMAILLRGLDEHGFVELAQFDPGDERFGNADDYGLPVLLGAGDLNADGLTDLFISTAPRNYLGFLQAEAGGPISGTLAPALRFQIFEEKSYMRSSPSFGPREMAAGDINGDGKEDLTLLIHDRILIYTQD